MRRVISLVMAMLALAGLVAAAAAEAKPDPSFGNGGTVVVKPEGPAGWANIGVAALISSRGGNSFAIGNQSTCPGGKVVVGCVTGQFVYHYFANGELDQGYGGGRGYQLPAETYGFVLGADTTGRALIAHYQPLPYPTTGPGTLTLTRLTKTGEPDLTFGQAGTATIQCACETEQPLILPGPKNSVRVIGRTDVIGGGPSTVVVAEFDSTGRPVATFGQGGIATLTVPGPLSPGLLARAPGGGLYLGLAGPDATPSSYLERISAKGRVDAKFDSRVKRAMKTLEAEVDSVEALVIGGKGQIEIFGSRSIGGGFELRLKPNGTVDPRFGSAGMVRLPFAVEEATLGTEGATMAVFQTGRAQDYARGVLRILADGKVDPKFGKKGELLAGLETERGLEIERGPHRTVTVSDLDESFCRQDCSQEAKLYRLIEE
jgi:hypothetical protein